MSTRRRAGLAAAAVATLALTAACGSSANQSAGTATTDNVQPAGQGTSDYGYGSSGGAAAPAARRAATPAARPRRPPPAPASWPCTRTPSSARSSPTPRA